MIKGKRVVSCQKHWTEPFFILCKNGSKIFVWVNTQLSVGIDDDHWCQAIRLRRVLVLTGHVRFPYFLIRRRRRRCSSPALRLNKRNLIRE